MLKVLNFLGKIIISLWFKVWKLNCLILYEYFSVDFQVNVLEYYRFLFLLVDIYMYEFVWKIGIFMGDSILKQCDM